MLSSFMHDGAFEHGGFVTGTMPLNGWGVSTRNRLRAVYLVQKQFSQGTAEEFISDGVFVAYFKSNMTICNLLRRLYLQRWYPNKHPSYISTVAKHDNGKQYSVFVLGPSTARALRSRAAARKQSAK